MAMALSTPPVPADFVQSGILWEIAHRYGDEMLLWDIWGMMPPPGASLGGDDLALLDEVAAQLVAADAGDMEAEAALFDRYLGDDRLHSGPTVLRISPSGDGPVRVDLHGPAPRS